MLKINLKWECVSKQFSQGLTRTERLNFGGWNTPMSENSFGVDELPVTYERRMRKFYE